MAIKGKPWRLFAAAIISQQSVQISGISAKHSSDIQNFALRMMTKQSEHEATFREASCQLVAS
jgi:hypothetical protein